MNEGWKCPVCEKGNAPFAMKCGHCAGLAQVPPKTYGKPYVPAAYTWPSPATAPWDQQPPPMWSATGGKAEDEGPNMVAYNL